jgi:hypothetical protein
VGGRAVFGRIHTYLKEGRVVGQQVDVASEGDADIGHRCCFLEGGGGEGLVVGGWVSWTPLFFGRLVGGWLYVVGKREGDGVRVEASRRMMVMIMRGEGFAVRKPLP